MPSSSLPWGRHGMHRERGKFLAMRITEQTNGHYKTQDVDLGRVYRWQPGGVTVECEECGKRSTHTKLNLLSSVL
jgi:hypothetical protein